MPAEAAACGANRYDSVIHDLRDRHHCPNCRQVVAAQVCGGCGAYLVGEEARRVLAASEQAARSLAAWQHAVAELLASRVPAARDAVSVDQTPQPGPSPTAPRALPPAAPGTEVAGSRAAGIGVAQTAALRPPAPAAPGAPCDRPGVLAPARQSTQVNQVAVFSAVGVGALVAAAMVFAWLVPLEPAVVRTVLLAVTGLATVATLWLRHRRPVSAAAIAVGVVALALLEVSLLSARFAPANRWYLSAAGTGVLALALGAAGLRLRLRPWVSAAVLLWPVAVLLCAPGVAENATGEASYWQITAIVIAGAAAAAIGRPAARLWKPVGDRSALAVEQRILAAVAVLTLLVAGLMVLGGMLLDSQSWGGAILLGWAVAAWLHSRSGADRWRVTAGAAATLAGPAAVAGLDLAVASPAAAAWSSWLVLAALSWWAVLRRTGHLSGALRGGFWVALAVSVPSAAEIALAILDAGWSVAEGTAAATRPLSTLWSSTESAWLLGALAAASGGLLTASRFQLNRAGPRLPRAGRALWAWALLAACVSATLLPGLTATAQTWLLLGLAGSCGALAWWSARRVRPLTGQPLVALDIGGQLILAAAVWLSWAGQILAITVGAAGVVAAVAWKLFVNRRGRHLLIGGAYGYALLLLGQGLWWYPPTGQAPDRFMVFGLLAVVASVLSVAVAAIPRIPVRYLFVLLSVSTVPWAFSIGLDLVERSWWTAAAAASLLAVEAVVFTTGRRAVPGWLRITVAALFLPTICVVAINAGAMLTVGSGSRFLLPVVAAASALVAVTAAPWTETLVARGMTAELAGRVRGGLEVSALVCSIAAVGLSITRAATGADTTLVICALHGIGAVVMAARTDRRWVWSLAGFWFTGVLWSALTLWQVTLVEWYTAPVALAGLGAGVALTRRSARWWPLPAAALQLALWPTGLLAIIGGDVVSRCAALAAAALVLAVESLPLRRSGGTPAKRLLAVAGSGIAVAGIAPVVAASWAARIAFGGTPGSGNQWLRDMVSGLADDPDRMFFAVVGVASAAILCYGWAGQLTHWAGMRTRWSRLTVSWRFGPALAVGAMILALTIGVAAPRLPSPTEFFVPTFGWPVVWFMWASCVGFLGLTILATWLRVGGRALLPPGWFCWLAALVVGIAGWSLRLLRVEFHALPLGLVLFACGLLVWRDSVGTGPRHTAAPPSARADPGAVSTTEGRGRRAWPNGFTKPSHLLVPGTLATLAPSTLAIWTDPLTWRAILVLILALAFLLVGARLLWQPVLIAGIADLGIAIVLVFVARQGSIDWVPWMTALVGAGGMLLGLGIYAERKREVSPGAHRPG